MVSNILFSEIEVQYIKATVNTANSRVAEPGCNHVIIEDYNENGTRRVSAESCADTELGCMF